MKWIVGVVFRGYCEADRDMNVFPIPEDICPDFGWWELLRLADWESCGWEQR